MKAIETVYNGYKFRSRLEARWAVFFDACGAKWEYEPQGYELKNGMWYLPDFLVHGVKLFDGLEDHELYVEVKGNMTEEDERKIYCFAEEIDTFNTHNLFIVVQDLPNEETTFLMWCKAMEDFYDGKSYGLELCIGTSEGCFLSASEDGGLRLHGDSTLSRIDDKKTMTAYALARQARFEHGESPEDEIKKIQKGMK